MNLPDSLNDNSLNNILFHFFDLSIVPCVILFPDAESFWVRNVNRAYLDLFDLDKSELINKDIASLYHVTIIPHETFSIVNSLQNVLEEKLEYNTNTIAFKINKQNLKKEETLYLQINNKPIVNAEGEVIFIIHSIIDKTTERLKEIALEDAELKTAFHFENNPYPMIIWDFATLKIIHANKKAVEKYGYTKEEFLQLDITQIRPEEDIKLIKEATQDVEHYGSIHHKVWRHQKKNGDIMFIEVNAHLTQMNERTVSITHFQDVTEKLIAEQELKDSEQKYSALFVSAADAIFVANAETGVLTDANEQACQLIGKTKEEIVGMHQTLLHPSEQLDFIAQQFKHFTSVDVYKTLETTVVHKDGHHIPVLISSGNNFSIGDKRFIASYFRDLTKSKKDESNLEKSTRLLKKAEEIAMIGHVEINEETEERLWSEGFNKILGIDEVNELHSLGDFLERVIPEDRQSHIEWLKTLSKGDAESVTNEVRIKRVNDGQERILCISGIKLKTEHGQPEKLFGVINDITERKQLELELRNSHAQLKKLTQEIPLGIIQLDSMGYENPIVKFVSKGIESIHKELTPEVVMNNADLLFDKIYDEDLELVVKSSYQSRANLTDVDIEFRSHDIGEVLKWIRLVYHPERNKDGSCSQYGYFQDITKEKMMLNALKKQNMELREIAWIQSHILRAPLAKLMGLADLLRSGSAKDKEDFFLEHIHLTCHELDAVIRDIVSKANKIEKEQADVSYK